MRLSLWGYAAVAAAAVAISGAAQADDFGFSIRYNSGRCGTPYYAPARSYSTYYAPRSYYYGHPVRSYSYSYAAPSVRVYAGDCGTRYYSGTRYYRSQRIVTPHVRSYSYRYRYPTRSYSYRSNCGTRIYYRR